MSELLYFLAYFIKPISDYYYILIFLMLFALSIIAIVIKKTISSKGYFEKNLSYTLLNTYIYINIVILSLVFALFIIPKFNSDVTSGIDWFLKLFLDNIHHVLFKLISLAIWVLVMFIVFVFLTVIPIFMQVFSYRFLLRKLKKS